MGRRAWCAIVRGVARVGHDSATKPPPPPPPPPPFLVFSEFVRILFLSYFGGALRHMGSSLPNEGSNPHHPTLEGEILTAGLPEKSSPFLKSAVLGLFVA